MGVCVAESVVREDPCDRGSGSWRLFDRVSGFRGSMRSSQWSLRDYVAKSVIHEDLWCRVFSGS